LTPCDAMADDNQYTVDENMRVGHYVEGVRTAGGYCGRIGSWSKQPRSINYFMRPGFRTPAVMIR
jgi:hypothetical protein